MIPRRLGGLRGNYSEEEGVMTEEEHRVARLERLEPVVGEWRIDASAFSFPPELADRARTTFEWTLDGAFLLQRSSVPVPEAPDGLSVIGPDSADGYTQHYFDSRGIARSTRWPSTGASGLSSGRARTFHRSRSTSAGWARSAPTAA
jgi:hypothetical protein